jgi:DNA-3-methyladenine glycosylase
MFGPAGRAYVYLVYGMYDCLNVVSGRDGEAGAVLLRAVEPITGQEAMRTGRAAIADRRRGRSGAAGLHPAASPADSRLASGPGRLCAAFGVDRTFTGLDLCTTASGLRLEPPAPADRAPDPAWTPRIGVGYAGEPWGSIPWRLVDRGSPALSGAGG